MNAKEDDLEAQIQIFEPEDYIILDELLDEPLDLTLLASPDYRMIEAEIIRLTNIERENRNLHPLTYNPLLSSSALLHTLDMAENHFISHTGSDGSDLSKRVRRAGYKHFLLVGENLAMGFTEPGVVVQGWMSSPGHRENILRKAFSEIGVGYIFGKVPTTTGGLTNGSYWTQHFGRPMHFPPFFKGDQWMFIR